MLRHSFRSILIILLFFLVTKKNQAQHKNDFEAGVFNIGFGGFIGGIGAIINKKPEQKTSKVFLKGFFQGALGGYLLFESKRMVRAFSKTGSYAYIWPSKIVNASANSILENATANRNFWKRWHINIGFNRIEFYTQNKFKVRYRIMPFALGNTIYAFTQGKLNVNESIKTGGFAFNINKIDYRNAEGLTTANTFFIFNKNKRTFSKQEIIAHEIIHVYQYESFSAFNPFLDKPLYNFNTKNWMKIYLKIFYTDFNYLSNGLIYLSNTNQNSINEKEAFYYTRFD